MPNDTPPGWPTTYAPPVPPRPSFEAVCAQRDRLRAHLKEIVGHAQACVSQRSPRDDAIIAEHIEAVRDIARAALAGDGNGGKS